MPALEMAQETGKLVAWLKKEGERVRKGEMLLEVETDKAVVEVEAASDGILAGISANVGDVVPVGRTIAWLVAPGEAPPAAESVAAPTARRSDTLTPTPTAPVAASGATPSASQRISPKARRLAKEHGVDLSGLKGSGPGGEILAEDVLAATKPNVGADLQVGPIGPVQVGPRPADLDRPPDGRAHHSELDHRSSFFCHTGNRCRRAARGAGRIAARD